MAPPKRCGACRYLNKRCTPLGTLRDYFPADEPQKFINCHKVYGYKRIKRLLMCLHDSKRAAAMDSLAYDGEMRLRDPVNGCIGPLTELSEKIGELQEQLKSAKEELARLENMKSLANKNE